MRTSPSRMSGSVATPSFAVTQRADMDCRSRCAACWQAHVRVAAILVGVLDCIDSNLAMVSFLVVHWSPEPGLYGYPWKMQMRTSVLGEAAFEWGASLFLLYGCACRKRCALLFVLILQAFMCAIVFANGLVGLMGIAFYGWFWMFMPWMGLAWRVYALMVIYTLYRGYMDEDTSQNAYF